MRPRVLKPHVLPSRPSREHSQVRNPRGIVASQGEHHGISRETAASGSPRLSPRGGQQEDIENEAPCAQTICFAEGAAHFL